MITVAERLEGVAVRRVEPHDVAGSDGELTARCDPNSRPEQRARDESYAGGREPLAARSGPAPDEYGSAAERCGDGEQEST